MTTALSVAMDRYYLGKERYSGRAIRMYKKTMGSMGKDREGRRSYSGVGLAFLRVLRPLTF